MLDKIKCPNCGELVEITEAFKHEVEEGAIASERLKHKEEIEKVRLASEATAAAKLKDQYEFQEKLVKEQLDSAKEQNKKLMETLTQMQKTINDLKQKDEERNLEMQKQMAENTEKARLEAIKKFEEEHYLKDLEKDKKLSDAMKAYEEIKRKLEQGSQQTQGEVMELDIEQALIKEFPNDKVLPVGKGIRGADITQEVWDRNGNYCGKIVWESKNAKWSDSWIPKLKEDVRQCNGDIALLVTENMPEGSENSVYKDGVWIIKRDKSLIISMAYTLRFSLVQVNFERKKNEGKMEKSEILFNYINGNSFKQRLEAIYEAFKNNEEEIEREMKWFQSKWAKQKKSNRIAMDHMYGLVGEIQGIDKNSLSNIKILELPEAIPLLESN